MQVLCDEDAEDLVEVVDGVEVESGHVVARGVPHVRERVRDYVEDVHV